MYKIGTLARGDSRVRSKVRITTADEMPLVFMLSKTTSFISAFSTRVR